jgi:penicillin-binding protein 2
VDRLLASSPAPAAAVVLGLDGPIRALALGRHSGADPATQVWRPASTVKPLTTWIAAERGVYHLGDTVTCAGRYPGYEAFHCFAEHGTLELTQALAVSCNMYFGELGARLGLAALSDGLRGFGLAQPTGLVPGEASGFIADPAWASARPNASNERFELLVAAGHGPLEVTVLQLAAAYAKLALLLQTPSPTVPDAVRAELEAGLRRVVEDASGTGHLAAVPGLEIAGKTGSGESSHFGEEAPAGAKDNGWFVGFTPVKAPKRLVAVLVLGAGGGGATAAPLAAKIFEAIRDGSARAADATPTPSRPAL